MNRIVLCVVLIFFLLLLCISCSLNPPAETASPSSDMPGDWNPSTELFSVQGDGTTLFLLNNSEFERENGYTFWSQNLNKPVGFLRFGAVLKKTYGNSSAGFGIVFRCSEVEGSSYLLAMLINTLGAYTIGKVKDGQFTFIQEWQNSRNLRRGYGVDNCIEVRYEQQEAVYVISINGQEEQRFMDAHEPVLTGNGCGYAVVIASNEYLTTNKVEVHFKPL